MSPYRIRESHDGLPKERKDLVQKRALAIRVEWALKIFWVTALTTMLVVTTIDVFNGQRARVELLDCTTPGGECYQRSTERTARVVKQLITTGRNDELATRRIVILAAACAANIRSEGADVTPKAVERCVKAQMKEDEDGS